MFERFTKPARRVVVRAQEEARELGDAHIATEHLLLALATAPVEPAGRALAAVGLHEAGLRDEARRLPAPGRLDSEALATLGIDLDEVRRRVEDAFGPGALDARASCRRGPRGRHVPFTPGAKRVLELALRHALARGDHHIGTEHVLLGLLSRERDDGAMEILRRRGRTAEQVRAALLAEIGPAGGRAAG
jgi:ATP-dependent Clp protease ATP-binding subunit ClpA